MTPSLVPTPCNQRLIHDPDYLNPLIVEKMLDHFDLDELGTNFPSSFTPDPTDFFEELSKRQNELLQSQQEEMVKKRRLQEVAREKLVETRAQRIAEMTNADITLVEETLQAQQKQGKPASRFDSMVPNQGPQGFKGLF